MRNVSGRVCGQQLAPSKESLLGVSCRALEEVGLCGGRLPLLRPVLKMKKKKKRQPSNFHWYSADEVGNQSPLPFRFAGLMVVLLLCHR